MGRVVQDGTGDTVRRSASPGHLTVEACDAAGRPLPGRDFANAVPLFGDCDRAPVVWKGTDTLGIRRDEPMVLRVRMDRASIYAFEIA